MSSVKSIHDVDIQTILQRNNTTSYHPSPLAWEDQILYFLLPDRFSNNKETGYVNNSGDLVTTSGTPIFTTSDRENAVKNEADTKVWLDAGARFVGGTLKGVASKLGYLKRLGITALWIGPIFKQVAALETYHGYGVQNFLDVDPRFGTKEDLRDLVRAAHEMGIYIILDIILNHCGNVFAYSEDNPYPNFDNGRAYPVKGFYDASRNATLPFEPVDLEKYPDQFPNGAIWPAELQNGNQIFTREGQIRNWDANPEYLNGDFFDLKDISLGADSVDSFVPTPGLEALVEIYKYWIAYADIDAYRLDTVKHMGKGPTRYFCSAVHEFAVDVGKNNFMVIGEITGSEVFETVEITGLDAALGIGGLQQALWSLPKGLWNPKDYFDLFRNAVYLRKGSHSWLRNKVVTMIDDHDQVWKGNQKGRFCSDALGTPLVFAASALNLTTLGIPCLYYGTEQSFDGSGSDGSPGHSSDQYIREAMFGGSFGAFRSKNAHFFVENGDVYKKLGEVAAIRGREIALRRGRQYLREISGTVEGEEGTYGYPSVLGGRMESVVAWSRVFDGVEVLCAISTDVKNVRSVWVTLDAEIHAGGVGMKCLYPIEDNTTLKVEWRGQRAVTRLSVPPAGFVLFKK